MDTDPPPPKNALVRRNAGVFGPNSEERAERAERAEREEREKRARIAQNEQREAALNAAQARAAAEEADREETHRLFDAAEQEAKARNVNHEQTVAEKAAPAPDAARLGRDDRKKHTEAQNKVLRSYVGFPIPINISSKLYELIKSLSRHDETKTCILSEKVDGMFIRLKFAVHPMPGWVCAHAYIRSGYFLCTLVFRCNAEFKRTVTHPNFIMFAECTMQHTFHGRNAHEYAFNALFGQLPNGRGKTFNTKRVKDLTFHVIWAGNYHVKDGSGYHDTRNWKIAKDICQLSPRFKQVKEYEVNGNNFNDLMILTQQWLDSGKEGAVIRFENVYGECFQDRLCQYKLKARHVGILINQPLNNKKLPFAWVVVAHTTADDEPKQLTVELQEVGELGVRRKHNEPAPECRPAWLVPWDSTKGTVSYMRHIVEMPMKFLLF